MLFANCAQQGILTGGNKDINPPMVDSTKMETPRNYSINFSSTRIEIPFNEYVSLENVKKQVIITPFLEKEPEIYVKGKKIIIDFKSALAPNTTYIINFGAAIRDITEGNILTNYNYVFSTGSFIDSLQYRVFVYDAYTKTPVSEALVMLYTNLEDSVVKKQKPIYFAKTNQAGVCTINNIAVNTYKVVVLYDKNSNYLFDQTDEKIGFKSSPLVLGTDTLSQKTDTLSIFTNYPAKKLITTSSYNKGKVEVRLNTPFVAYKSGFGDSIAALAINGEIAHNRTFDTLSFWLKPLQNNKQDLTLSVDTYGTTKVKVVPPTEVRKLGYSTNAIANLKPKEKLKIVFDEPIQTIDTSKLELKLNDKKVAIKVFQISLTEIEISAPWQADELYDFKAFGAAFTSYYGNISDTLSFIFGTNNEAKYGSLKLTLEGTALNEHSGDFIVLVLQNNKVILQLNPRLKQNNTIALSNLTPGKYTICILFDANKNGVWDTGDYFTQRYPERIEYYTEPIEIRKGWDAELIWKIEK